MGKIIQIRGSNAVGKTTTIRSFVDANKMRIEKIDIGGINTDITTDTYHKIIVLGRYDVLNGGCDRFKNREHVINTIIYLIKKYKPNTIVFEGFVYGKTFKFAKDIDALAKVFNYKYLPIVLYRSPENALRLLYNRNGESKINEKTFYECYRSSLSSYNKIKKSGINIKIYNTDNIKISEMGNIIKENL